LIAWIVIVAVVGLLIVTTMVGSRPSAADAEQIETTAEILPPSAMLEMGAKATLGEPDPAARIQGLKILPMFAADDADQLRIALLTAEIENQQSAIELIDLLLNRESPPLSDPLREDAELFRAVMVDGSDAITPEQIDALTERHKWYATLALTHGQSDDAPPRDAIYQSARSAYNIQRLMMSGIAVIVVVGIGLSITGLILILVGKIRPRYAAPSPGGSVMLETFAMFLVALTVLSILVAMLAEWIGYGALLLNWILLPVALWPLLRGLPRAHLAHAVGWNKGKGVLVELASGVVGYIACLPIVALGIMLTIMLTAIVGGDEGSAPTHPLAGMLNNASVFELIVLIQIATVWAPVVEETFFRGAFYHHLRGRLHPLLAGLVVGVIFAAIHPQGLVAIPALGSIGLSLALIREWRGSIIASVAAHAANNGFIVILLVTLLNA